MIVQQPAEVELGADEVHRARLTVARKALDAEDCLHLLDMLGLLPRTQSPAEPDDPPAETGLPRGAKPHRFMLRGPRRA